MPLIRIVLCLYFLLSIIACNEGGVSERTAANKAAALTQFEERKLEFPEEETKIVVAPEEEIFESGEVFHNSINITKRINEANITCEDKLNCPGYVGSLIITKKFEDGSVSFDFCSFTLISSNEIIANDHCFEDEDVESFNCDGAYAIFPETSEYKKEVVSCESIQSASSEYRSHSMERSDWAILKLSKDVSRPFAKPNINGVKNNLEVTLYPAFYGKDAEGYTMLNPITAVIKKINCKSSMSGVINQQYISPYSFSSGFGCEEKLEQGNSGSGVINGDQEIVGVFKTIALEQNIAFKGEDVQINSKAITASNLHCVSSLNPNASSNCLERKLTVEELKIPYISSFVLSEENKQDYIKELAKINYVIWEKTNEASLDLMGLNDHEAILTPGHAAAMRKSYFELVYPKLPACIKRLEAGDEVTVKLPFFTPEFRTMKMNEAGVRSTAMKLNFLGYQFKYISSQNNYVGRLERVEDFSEVNQYINLKNKLSSNESRCEHSNITTECSDIDYINESISNLMNDSLLEDYIFSNEHGLLSGQLIKKEIMLKVCE